MYVHVAYTGACESNGTSPSVPRISASMALTSQTQWVPCSILTVSRVKILTRAETRFITLDRGYCERLLLVIWTERDEDVIRIISARKASPGEARGYED